MHNEAKTHSSVLRSFGRPLAATSHCWRRIIRESNIVQDPEISQHVAVVAEPIAACVALFTGHLQQMAKCDDDMIRRYFCSGIFTQSCNMKWLPNLALPHLAKVTPIATSFWAAKALGQSSAGFGPRIFAEGDGASSRVTITWSSFSSDTMSPNKTRLSAACAGDSRTVV